MKELSLEELKAIEMDILKTFNAFCVKNNIRYYLAFGTLLGAIRYKGFIPWDDDIDVLVPREDYERLMMLFQDSDKYRLYAFERNERYRFPFAKLCDMSTSLTEVFYPNNGVDLGVGIDIFPLDNWADDMEAARKELRRISRYNSLLSFTKGDKIHTKNPLKYMVWGAIVMCCKLCGSKYFIRKVIKECNKPEQKGSRYIGAKAWPIWGERVITPAEAFTETIEIEFEGELFPAPKGYDIYLTCLYGDYLPEPPVEKRKTHHSFKAYKL